LRNADKKFRNIKKFQYGIPAYIGQFRALGIRKINKEVDESKTKWFEHLQHM
jgi:hypothetical protein